MHLSELTIQNLRSCEQLHVRLRPDVTVLTGRNGAGKSTALDALRQLTEPVDGSRIPELTEIDLPPHSPLGSGIRLHAALADIEPEYVGTYRDALLPGDGGLRRCASWSMTYTPPYVGRRRGTTTWYVGEGRESTAVPVPRSAVRHVHLPADRDAIQELSGPAGASRIRVMLEAQLATSRNVNAFLNRVGFATADVTAEPVVQAAGAAISRTMAALTADPEEVQVRLLASDENLHQLSRMLRAGLAGPFGDFGPSGLGHVHALYLATVLAELELVREADLTLLLIDAPEAHLHPALHPLLITYLQHVARASRLRTPKDPAEPAGQLQVVVSTNAPSISTALSARDIVVLTRRGLQSTKAATVTESDLPDSEVRQLDRYLSMSRLALLHGAPMLLVPTTVEAMLISAMAELVLGDQTAGKGWAGRSLAEFRAATVIAASDVSCGVILKVLIAATGESRFGQRIAVLTDADPDTAAAMSTSSIEHIRWCGLGAPIWQLLMCPANEELLRTALLDVADDGERRWQTVLAEDLDQRPQAFQNLFSPGLGGETPVCGIRYANALADLLAGGELFAVPDAIAAAIRHLAHVETDIAGAAA